MIWGRKGHVAHECPKSLISADSLSWLEQYQVWRIHPAQPLTEMDARSAEAFLILEGERLREKAKGE